jgi:hypothetical protein
MMTDPAAANQPCFQVMLRHLRIANGLGVHT